MVRDETGEHTHAVYVEELRRRREDLESWRKEGAV